MSAGLEFSVKTRRGDDDREIRPFIKPGDDYEIRLSCSGRVVMVPTGAAVEPGDGDGGEKPKPAVATCALQP